ncbi:MAG: NTP transferase domain-containing protein [Telmatospirillum sp.]|nr:NTP transferase domain-containing protein [Telmatospirillum sp.]
MSECCRPGGPVPPPERTGPLAGLVLAAGLSSRMDGFKPLMPLAGIPPIERVVKTLKKGGLSSVTVVIGHHALEMEPVVRALGAVPVVNSRYEEGMFSSVTAGLRALPRQCAGCVLLPVDIPLVRPDTIATLVSTFASDRPGILYPSFRGRRGHPPVIARHLFAAILEDDGAGGLRAILARHAAEAMSAPVYDEGTTRDMDTPEDRRRLEAEFRRPTDPEDPNHRDLPTLTECDAILADLQPSADARAHAHAVAATAAMLCESLREQGIPLDAGLIQAGALLHDIAKGRPGHATAGARLVARLGFPAVAPLVAAHSDLDFHGSRLDESALVFLADKLVRGDSLVSLEQRFSETFQRLAGNPGAVAAALTRLGVAEAIARTIERETGRPVADILTLPSASGCEKPASVSGPRILSVTESLCPICLRRVRAERVEENDAIHLRKTCPDHGAFSTVLWRGAASYPDWGRHAPEPVPVPAAETPAGRGCPYDCGLCPDHRQQSCCVLLEVTTRCNLSCPVCFAGAGGATGGDPDQATLRSRLQALRDRNRPVNIQLSGGEPTLRDDLPEIVAMTREMGFPFVQLNTNGIRLARDAGYVRRLKTAGLDCVFLQFDGLTDEVYRTLRGADLLDIKIRAIEACAEAGLGTVLVPVLVPGVNVSQVGDLIRFAAARTPWVRTVHFQPISYFGRYPHPPADKDRLTLPELLSAIEAQAEVPAESFRPGSAENPYCSFNGDFIVGPEGSLTPVSSGKSSCCCGTTDGDRDGNANRDGDTNRNGDADRAEQARRFVARRWAATEDRAPAPATGGMIDTSSLDAFLERRKRSLCISAMVFQDAWSIDLDRLRQCYIHVAMPDRTLVPLCALNVTGQNGGTLYRRDGS